MNEIILKKRSGMLYLILGILALPIAVLLIVLCGNKEAQPIVNSGGLY